MWGLEFAVLYTEYLLTLLIKHRALFILVQAQECVQTLESVLQRLPKISSNDMVSHTNVAVHTHTPIHTLAHLTDKV